jgi:hypothetical protein
VGDSVCEIYSAIDRVNNPAVVGVWLSGYAFLPKQSRVREGGEQPSFDQFLAADIQFKFNVVLRDLVGAFWGAEFATHEFSDFSGCEYGGMLCLAQIKLQRGWCAVHGLLAGASELAQLKSGKGNPMAR